MRIIVTRLLGNRIGTSPNLTSTYDIAYDEGVAERAADLIKGLQRHNCEPLHLVAGLRAFLSLHAFVHNHFEGMTLMVVGSGGSDLEPVIFHGCPIELDMTTEDQDDLRITCGTGGLALALAAQPDVQVYETMQEYFATLRRKVGEGRRDHLKAFDDVTARQIGFSDGDEKHVVRLGTLRQYYEAPHFKPIEQAVAKYQADTARVLAGE